MTLDELILKLHDIADEEGGRVGTYPVVVTGAFGWAESFEIAIVPHATHHCGQPHVTVDTDL